MIYYYFGGKEQLYLAVPAHVPAKWNPVRRNMR
jgi:hypothetical protein